MPHELELASGQSPKYLGIHVRNPPRLSAGATRRRAYRRIDRTRRGRLPIGRRTPADDADARAPLRSIAMARRTPISVVVFNAASLIRGS